MAKRPNDKVQTYKNWPDVYKEKQTIDDNRTHSTAEV